MGVTLRIRQVEPETRDLGSFDRAPIRIGKAPECDVRFPGVVGISGVHAVLEWKDGKVWITDPGARNPLEVDGAMIPYAKPAEIRSGSCIRLGSVALIVEYSWDERPRGGRRICMPNSETRLDVAKARLHAYLEDTLDDPGYEPEDLLLHDLWVVENHDLPWLVKQMSRSELPASRRRWVTSLLRSSEHQEEMERAIVASGGGSEPGQT
jgi:predicted component of type VI protein secretion system